MTSSLGAGIDEESFNVMVAISEVPTRGDCPIIPIMVESISIGFPAAAFASSASSSAASSALPVDETALFEMAVEAARTSQQNFQEVEESSAASKSIEMAIAKPAFKTPEEQREFAAEWAKQPLQSYVAAMIDQSTTLEVPQTAAEKAAAEQEEMKKKFFEKQQGEMAAAPKTWWQEALSMAGNIKTAAGEALAETDAKRAAETKLQPQSRDPLQNFMRRKTRDSLYKQLDQAIDRGDYEEAAAINKMIQEQK
uniref:UVR domain-containing protein n=1 Tax=Haptolina brevifila TaxID=156173 RepID=A0A7S2FLD0_9EUKA|mmetsp:Transcript_14926/g.30016  ORF Transcript_14926/g.30016 Transcript_14926/m.30016 type:complete len:253 (+) Transcript_14926:1-759(+)